MELKLLLVVVALYLFHQLLKLYVFCILVDELLLCPLKFASQLELLLSGFNFFLSASLIIFLQLLDALMELSFNLFLLLCLYLLYLGLHHRDLLPELVHQLVLVPVGLLAWWLRIQLSL